MQIASTGGAATLHMLNLVTIEPKTPVPIQTGVGRLMDGFRQCSMGVRCIAFLETLHGLKDGATGQE